MGGRELAQNRFLHILLLFADRGHHLFVRWKFELLDIAALPFLTFHFTQGRQFIRSDELRLTAREQGFQLADLLCYLGLAKRWSPSEIPEDDFAAPLAVAFCDAHQALARLSGPSAEEYTGDHLPCGFVKRLKQTVVRSVGGAVRVRNKDAALVRKSQRGVYAVPHRKHHAAAGKRIIGFEPD